MAGILTDVGGQYLLNVLFGTTAKPTAFTLQLFTDSNVPSDSDTNTTHTLMTGVGYADQAMSNNATISLVGGIPTATFPSGTFTFTGALVGNTIKGYQVLQGTTLLFQELLDVPYAPSLNGDTLSITPSFALGNGTPT